MKRSLPLILLSLTVSLFGLAACSGGETKADNPCGDNPCANPCGGNPCGGSAGGAELSAAEQEQLERLMGTMASYESWNKWNDARFKSPTHGNHMVDIYADKAATEAVEANSYPAGATVLKTGHKDGSLNMYWYMVKMEDGYDAEYGNWFYATLGGDGKLMMAGNSSNPKIQKACVNCHNGASDRDFVFGPPDYQE